MKALRSIIPIIVVALSVTSIVLILNDTGPDNFQTWTYLGAFFVAFFQCLYLVIYLSVIRSLSRSGTSMFNKAFRQARWPSEAWIVYLIFRASQNYPVLASLSQLIDFTLFCLSSVLFAGWWELGIQNASSAKREFQHLPSES